jgi:hypothetical protein
MQNTLHHPNIPGMGGGHSETSNFYNQRLNSLGHIRGFSHPGPTPMNNNDLYSNFGDHMNEVNMFYNGPVGSE